MGELEHGSEKDADWAVKVRVSVSGRSETKKAEMFEDEEIVHALQDLVTIKQEVANSHLALISLGLADLPLMVMAAYIVSVVGAPDLMIIVALALSAIAAGMKLTMFMSAKEKLTALKGLLSFLGLKTLLTQEVTGMCPTSNDRGIYEADDRHLK